LLKRKIKLTESKNLILMVSLLFSGHFLEFK